MAKKKDVTIEDVFKLVANVPMKDIFKRIVDLGLDDKEFYEMQESIDGLKDLVASEQEFTYGVRRMFNPLKINLLAMISETEDDLEFGDYRGEDDFVDALFSDSEKPKENNLLQFPTPEKSSGTSSNETYTLKLSLKGSKPPIWRRVEVPSNISLVQVHTVIQACMDWDDCHLHSFRKGKLNYAIPSGEPFLDMHSDDERTFSLSNILFEEKKKILYTYDFGDNWEVTITLEHITLFPIETPRCIKGKRLAPPEDCGGMYSYEELRCILADKTDPEFEEMIERAEYFGLLDDNSALITDKFSDSNIEEINENLKVLFL